MPMGDDYDYRGLIAQAWDLHRGDTSSWGDRLFFRTVIEREGEPALDVGCGTGRLLLDYLGQRLDVDGVNSSPDMLALCREKAAAAGLDVAGRVFEQPMQALNLPRRYRTIFVPSLSFLLLTDDGDAAEAMRRFHDHLEPGGVLAMALKSRFWDGDPPPQMQWSDWRVEGEAALPGDGAVIRRTLRERFDHVGQRQYEENCYELVREGLVVQSERYVSDPQVQWYDQAQARAVFERAGFADLTITAEDGFEPAGSETARFKIRGRRRP